MSQQRRLPSSRPSPNKSSPTSVSHTRCLVSGSASPGRRNRLSRRRSSISSSSFSSKSSNRSGISSECSCCPGSCIFNFPSDDISDLQEPPENKRVRLLDSSSSVLLNRDFVKRVHFANELVKINGTLSHIDPKLLRESVSHVLSPILHPSKELLGSEANSSAKASVLDNPPFLEGDANYHGDGTVSGSERGLAPTKASDLTHLPISSNLYSSHRTEWHDAERRRASEHPGVGTAASCDGDDGFELSSRIEGHNVMRGRASKQTGVGNSASAASSDAYDSSELSSRIEGHNVMRGGGCKHPCVGNSAFAASSDAYDSPELPSRIEGHDAMRGRSSKQTSVGTAPTAPSFDADDCSELSIQIEGHDAKRGPSSKQTGVETAASCGALLERIHQSNISCGQHRFGQQSLVIFHEQRQFAKVNANQLVNPSNVDLYIGIDRNPNGQIYAVSDLDISAHGTIPCQDFPRFINLGFPDPIIENTGSDDDSDNGLSVPVSRRVRHFHIPVSDNFLDSSEKVCVINNAKEWCSNRGATVIDEVQVLPNEGQDISTKEQKKIHDPLEYCTSKIIAMFEEGLSQHFSYDKKKRSGTLDNNPYDETGVVSHCSVSVASVAKSSVASGATSKSSKARRIRKKLSKKKKKKKKASIDDLSSPSNTKCKHIQSESFLPTITLGWSQTDAHEYKKHKVTIAGNVKPFLRDSSLPRNIKTHLLNCVKCLIATVPHECSFNLSEDDDEALRNLRGEMMSEFEKLLGGDGKCQHFACEGVTILIPLCVGFHKDTNNCSRKGMRAVLQVNVRVPMNESMIAGGRTSILWKWLEHNGYYDSFPATIILYGRKSVSSICEKLSKMESFAQRDDLRRCVKWAFQDRVYDDVNFENYVWNNDNFKHEFINNCAVEESSRPRSFHGQMWTTTAFYQKIVSTCYSKFRRLFRRRRCTNCNFLLLDDHSPGIL